MPAIHLFNPENDLALASGMPFYTARPNARALHDAGAALPFWWAEDGDRVIASNLSAEWFEQMKQTFALNADIFQRESDVMGHVACPWGWSLDAKCQFVKEGVDASILPDDKVIERLRELSHRRLTIDVMRQLRKLCDFIKVPLPIEAESTDEAMDFIAQHRSCYVKSPWSSSGRGVFSTIAMPDEELSRRIGGIIRRQGSVMCEVELDKVADFAMLFYSDGAKVKHIGYSLFFNAATSAYVGNRIMSDEKIIEYLSQWINLAQLQQVSVALESILTTIFAADYQGYFGVDMMIYRDADGCMSIAPCVEVNLRMTMGVVAWLWRKRYLAEGCDAILRVEYRECTASDVAPVVVNGKLKCGTISLIPPNPQFFITIEVV